MTKRFNSMRHLALFGLIGALAASACAFAQSGWGGTADAPAVESAAPGVANDPADGPAPRVADTGPEAPASPPDPGSSSTGEGPALWRLSDDDSVLWLFGTIHMLDADIEWRRPAVAEAFNGADTIFLERASTLESDAVAQRLMIERGQARDGVRLSARLSPEAAARLPAAAARFGASLEQIDQMRPWFAALWLGVNAATEYGADPLSGVDRILEAEARARGAELIFFESSAEQVGFFADLSEATQVELLESTLEEIDDEAALIGDLIEAWRSGDIAAIEAELMADYETAPEALEAVIWRRNRAWAEVLNAWMAGEGEAFLAVGAAHLVGAEGLPNLLMSPDRVLELR